MTNCPARFVRAKRSTALDRARDGLRLKPLAAQIRAVLFLSLILGFHVTTALAGPQGGKVVGGTGTIVRPDTTTTIITAHIHDN